MIIRVIVKNIFSFKEQSEFNFLPSQGSRLKYHKYKAGNKDLLKLAAIYGANGSGKSNFIKAVSLLRRFVRTGSIPYQLKEQKFRLSSENRDLPIEIGIEFFFKNKFFYYSISINEGKVVEEYLCTIDGKDNSDKVIFHRKLSEKATDLKFADGFSDKKENVILENLIKKDLLKPDKSLLNLLNGLSDEAFDLSREAFSWFDEFLVIIFPQTKATSLAILFDEESHLKSFASEMICSFGTGISNFNVEKKPIMDYMGDNEKGEVEKMTAKLIENPDQIIEIFNKTTGEEVHAVNEDGKVIAKKLFFEHSTDDDSFVSFNFLEESDGTQRLIEYIPALYDLIHEQKTYLIDEIERSIHPIIIREILAKFSLDPNTRGQLAFTTHESNLLDQDILRTDEIWFAQKNTVGATQIYSLSSYKEHSTIDIRKGYLNGRYGAIPFVGNLQDLNWHKYVE